MLVSPITTTQRLEQAGFDRRQAEAIAVGYDKLDEKMDSMMMLLREVVHTVKSELSEVKSELSEVKEGLAATNRKVDALGKELSEVKAELSEVKEGLAATDRKVDALGKEMSEFKEGLAATDRKVDALGKDLTDFQIATERRFSETNQEISRLREETIQNISDAKSKISGGWCPW